MRLQPADKAEPHIIVIDAFHAVELFKDALYPCPRNRKIIRSAKQELRGKNLACWCAPGAPCHADVLLEIANRPTCEACA